MVSGYVPRNAEYRRVGDKDSSLAHFSVKVGEKPPPTWMSVAKPSGAAAPAGTRLQGRPRISVRAISSLPSAVPRQESIPTKTPERSLIEKL